MKKLAIAPYSVPFFLLTCVIAAILAITAMAWLKYAAYIFSLGLMFALAVAVFKIGNLRLGGELAHRRCSPGLFIVLALTVQLGCYLLFSYFAMAMQFLAQTTVPVQQLGQNLRDLAGFFLPFYALLGCAIRHGQGQATQQPTFYHLLGITGNSAVARTIAAFIRQALIFAVILPLGFALVVLSAHCAAALQWPFQTGWRLWLILPLLLLPTLPSWPQFTRYLWVKHVPLGLQLLLLLLAYIVLIVVVNVLTATINYQVPIYLSTQSAAVLKYQALTQPLQATALKSFTLIMALAFSPLVAAVIAYFAQGQRIYTVILSFCGLPLLLLLASQAHFIIGSLALMTTSLWLFTITVTALLLILLSFSKFFDQALLATIAPVKNAVRRRLPYRIMHGLLYACIGIAVLQIAGGIVTVYLLAFSLVAPCVFIFFSLILRFLLNANNEPRQEK